MDRSVACHNAGVLDANIPTPQIGHDAASFPDEQGSGSNVPGGQALLPKPIEPSGRNVRQIECCRSRPPNPAGPLSYPRELFLVFDETRHIAEGKAGANQGEFRIIDARDS